MLDRQFGYNSILVELQSWMLLSLPLQTNGGIERVECILGGAFFLCLLLSYSLLSFDIFVLLLFFRFPQTFAFLLESFKLGLLTANFLALFSLSSVVCFLSGFEVFC